MAYEPRRRALTEIRSTSTLEKAMRARDVNASELATMAHTSRQTISNLRRGVATKTSVATARAIAHALRIAPGKLWDLDDVDDDERAQAAS